MQAAVEDYRYRQLEVAPGDAGERGDDQRVADQLLDPEARASFRTVTALRQQQGDDGEQVEHRHQEAHENAGPGETVLAVGVEDDGQANVGEVAAKRSLAEAAAGRRRIAAQGGVAVGEQKADRDGQGRTDNQRSVEIGEKIGGADLVKKKQRQADVVDQTVGLEKEGVVDEAKPFEQVAQGDDHKDRQNDGENVDEKRHASPCRAVKLKRINRRLCDCPI